MYEVLTRFRSVKLYTFVRYLECPLFRENTVFLQPALKNCTRLIVQKRGNYTKVYTSFIHLASTK